MDRVEVEPVLLQWAVERAGLSIGDAEERFPKFREWMTGDTRPTLRQLERFANATTTPFGFLFLPEPPVETLPVADFRTVSETSPRRPSPNLLETVYAMQRRQDFMHELLEDEGHDVVSLVGLVRTGSDPVEAAVMVREALNLREGWARSLRTWSDALKELREAAEWAGIFVVINGVVGNNTHRKLDPNEFRGFALVDDLAPIVFVNGADAKVAQIFTLAHELAHIAVAESGVSDLPYLTPSNHAVERFSNAVAAELLVPAAELESIWPQAARTDNPFNYVARHFKVSKVVAARRAFALELISADAYRAFFDEEVRQHSTTASRGGDFWANQGFRVGRRFGRAVVRAAREGRLLYRDAYDLCDLYGKTFDAYAERVAPRRQR